jgi:hypothetical protein
MARYNPSPEEVIALKEKGFLKDETAQRMATPEPAPYDWTAPLGAQIKERLKIGQPLIYTEDPTAKAVAPQPEVLIKEEIAPVAAKPLSDGPVPASIETPKVEPSVVAAPQVQQQSSAPSGPFTSGFNMQKKAIEEQMKVGQLIAAEKVGAAEEIAQAAKARQEQMLVDQKEREKQLAEGEAKRQEASDAVKNYKFQDYWADKSTASRLGAALAIGFGAYAQAINGGPNSAMQIIDDAVMRDMKLQEKKFDQLKGNVSEADSAYGRLYKKLGDKELTNQQFYISGLEAIRAKGEAQLSKFGSAQAKAQGMAALGELQTKIDTAKSDYNLKLEELGAKKRSAQASMQENFVPTLGIYTTSKEGAAKINELAGATRTAQDGIGQLLSLTNESGKSLSPEVKAQAETTASIVKAALRVPILGPGTVNDAERAILDKIVADPTRIFSLDNVSKVRLKSLSERLEAGLNQQAKAYAVPSQTASGSSPLQTGMIKVKLPNGAVGAIPADKIQAALARGAEIIR